MPVLTCDEHIIAHYYSSKSTRRLLLRQDEQDGLLNAVTRGPANTRPEHRSKDWVVMSDHAAIRTIISIDKIP